MELLKKFASRKFIVAAASFVFSVAAVIFGEGNEQLQIVGSVGALVAPLAFMIIEGLLDGKAMNVNEYVPTVSQTVYDLVQLYENKYGENGISNFVQDLSVLVKKHFDEDVDKDAEIPERLEGTE